MLSEWIYNPRGDVHNTVVKTLTWDTEYAIVKIINSDKQCVVVHRGTDNVKDLLSDLMSQITDKCDEWGHVDAFVKSFETYEDKLLTDMDRFYNSSECSSYVSVGHSLGGARAIVLHTKYNHIVKMAITFGSPKTCCDSYDDTVVNIVRVVNAYGGMEDPIPSLPIHKNVFSCGGRLIKLEKKSQLRVFELEYSEPTVDSEIKFLDQHKIENYVKVLMT